PTSGIRATPTAQASHSSGSYSSYPTSSSKATPTATPGLADEVIHSFLATNADDVDLIHEDLDQIDDLDLEEMDINWQIAMTAIKIKKFYKKTGRRPRVDGKMHVAFDKRKVECFNCQNTGHFARECKINWVEQTADEELNHALMAFTVNNEVSMCSKLCLDSYNVVSEINTGSIKLNTGIEQASTVGEDKGRNSYNALQAKYDELQSEFGDQEAALTAHKLAVKKLESQLKASHKQQSSLNEKLNFQANQIFEKDEKLKKYRRIGMKAVKDKDALQKIVDSCPTGSDASSTVYSTCPSNDSDGELGAVSDHSVNDDPINDHIEQVTIATQKTQPQVPKPQQTVDPSCAQHVKTPRQPIRTPVTPSPNRQNWNQRMERELGAGYSFERKPCFVCGSLSHLIKNCDYYEKKMAREAALKSKRVVNTNDRQATPAWNNTNRINKANKFTPRPVNVRPNLSTASNTIKTGRVNGNTSNGNINSDSVHVNAGT
ncbi:ribonuclease H-like domain-containing protein, partial [Tanacetum coccineum]